MQILHNTTSLEREIEDFAITINQAMERLLPEPDAVTQNIILHAMRYALLGHGKRIRAFMMHCVGKAFNAVQNDVIHAACAIEMLHCYSLIHDDLPALDNDDLRRGRPSLHKQFDEATAILTGDSLLTMAFEIITNQEFNIADHQKVRIVHIMSHAAGYKNLIHGQIMDIYSTKDITAKHVRTIHLLKTAAMFKAACAISSILGNATEEMQTAIVSYAEHFGLLFQLLDDWLDCEYKAHELNLVSLIGRKAAQEMADDIMQTAIHNLSILPQQNAAQLIAMIESIRSKLC